MIALIELINRLLVDFGDRRSVHLDTIRLIYQTLWISVYKPCVQFLTRNVDGRRDMYISCIDCLMLSKIISKQTNRAICELWRGINKQTEARVPHTCHYLNQWWSLSLTPTRVTRPNWLERPKGTSKLLLFVHYSDFIMSTMASQITTSLTIVYSIVYSGVDQRKHESSASLAFVRGIHRSPVNSPHRGPVARKMFPFDDVMMTLSNHVIWYNIYKQVFGWGE